MLRVGHLILLAGFILIYAITFGLLPEKRRKILTVICFCLCACVICITICYHVDTSVPLKEYRETFAIKFLTMDSTAGETLFTEYTPDALVRENARAFEYWWGMLLSAALLFAGAIPIRKKRAVSVPKKPRRVSRASEK